MEPNVKVPSGPGYLYGQVGPTVGTDLTGNFYSIIYFFLLNELIWTTSHVRICDILRSIKEFRLITFDVIQNLQHQILSGSGVFYIQKPTIFHRRFIVKWVSASVSPSSGHSLRRVLIALATRYESPQDGIGQTGRGCTP